ncbi:MAG: hypothetical protein WA913_14345 [Pricia sp.]
MTTTKYYPPIWQTAPFSLESYNWDFEGRCIKDMVLKNEYVEELRISEMNLDIKRFSAFDSNGKEHAINDFPGQRSLPIKGTHAGEFLKSKGVLLLDAGCYTTLRFYLGSDSTFTYSDRLEEPGEGLNHLDFEIENGLTIEGGESPEAVLRFDFVPFKVSKFMIAVKQLFKSPRRTAGRLVGSFGH